LSEPASFRSAFDRAVVIFHHTEQVFCELGEVWGLIWTLANLAHLDHLRGDDECADRLFRESVTLAHGTHLSGVDRRSGLGGLR